MHCPYFLMMQTEIIQPRTLFTSQELAVCHLCAEHCFAGPSAGTTFPLVFTIQQAFTRREKAISLIANLKASAVALYYHHRDWSQDEGFPASLGNDHTLAAMQCRHLLLKLLRDVRSYLVAPSVYESYAEARLLARGHPYMDMMLAHVSLGGLSQLSFTAAMADVKQQEPALQALRRCYHDFSKLSVLNEKLTARAGYTRGGEPASLQVLGHGVSAA